MIDDDPTDAGRDFKFIGDQFQLNVSALARTELDQSMDPDWNISAAVAKKEFSSIPLIQLVRISLDTLLVSSSTA